MWWWMPIIPALRRQREDCEFKDSLDYMGKIPHLKQTKQQKSQQKRNMLFL
jgi:hypothetical protein